MESISSEVSGWFLQHGPFGGFALIMLGLYMYERYARAKDRAAFDDKIQKLQEEHIATLKVIMPLAEKFTDTMDMVLPLALRNLSGRIE